MIPKQQKKFGFPKTCRLVKNGQFRSVLSLRKRAYDGLVCVFAMPNDLCFSRIGISAGRATGNAVLRNRFKRLAREVFRLNTNILPGGFDFVVMPGPAARKLENLTLEKLQNSLLKLAIMVAK